MHERLEVLQTQLRQPATDVVLHGLHIVHGHGLDLGQFRHGLRVEVGDDGPQTVLLLLVQGFQTGQRALFTQVDEPFDLHVHALAVERGFREVIDQDAGLGAIAAVQGAQRDGRGLLAQGHASGGESMWGLRHGPHSSTPSRTLRLGVPRRRRRGARSPRAGEYAGLGLRIHNRRCPAARFPTCALA